MPKFNVGDIIYGTATRVYTWTNTDMTRGEVIALDPDDYDDIQIKILEHKSAQSQVGQVYSVDSQHFELVVEDTSEVSKEGEIMYKIKCIPENLESTDFLNCNQTNYFDNIYGAAAPIRSIINSKTPRYYVTCKTCHAHLIVPAEVLNVIECEHCKQASMTTIESVLAGIKTCYKCHKDTPVPQEVIDKVTREIEQTKQEKQTLLDSISIL